MMKTFTISKQQQVQTWAREGTLINASSFESKIEDYWEMKGFKTRKIQFISFQDNLEINQKQENCETLPNPNNYAKQILKH